MKRYVYFVSYIGSRGRGNGEAYVNKKITNIEDVKDLEKTICKDENLNGVIIQNFQLLRKERVRNDKI